MSLQVDYYDLENAGFDAGGTEILHYQGEPFTGIIVEYKNQVLIAEEEYKYGYKSGIQRTYYNSGQIKEEYHEKFNRINGAYKYWDENGNLILHILHDNDGNEIQRIIG